jgi:integrase
LYLKEKNFAKHCLENTMSLMKNILERYADMELPRITSKILTEMQDMLVQTDIKGSTVRRKMSIVKALLHWGHRKGYIDIMPLFPIMPTAHHARYVPPTQEEVAQLYDVAAPHIKRVLVLGYQFGMRVGPSELLRLKWQDVDFASAVVRVPNANKGNHDPWREVPIRKSLMPLLLKWREEDKSKGYEYVVTFKDKPVTCIRHAWRQALKRAGMTRHIRPYDLRHGFATEAIAAGVDYGTVAELMGHKSPVMVMQHYQHVKNAQKKAAVEALPEPPICAD